VVIGSWGGEGNPDSFLGIFLGEGVIEKSCQGFGKVFELIIEKIRLKYI